MASALDTINQIATSAAKAVWGDTNAAETDKEPISGATGDVSKGEPYDAGNLDPKEQNKVETSLKDEENGPSDLAEGEYYALSSAAKDKPLPETPRNQEPMDNPMDKPMGNPVEKPVDKPMDKPMDKSMDKPKNTDADADKNTDANPEEGKPLDELTGPGPRPVEVLAKENGGNAAAASSNDAVTSSNSPQEDKSQESAKGMKPEPSSSEQDNDQHREATEAEYVKTTGLAADGGDFDAAKPGAGLEADRLMEQKGLKTDDDENDNKAGSTGRKSSDSGHHKDKPSLGERIKNKLHRH